MILVEPVDLAKALVAELNHGKPGLARLLPASTGRVEDLAQEYLALAASLRPGEAVVRSAEPSLRVGARGAGGRCTHLAALVAAGLPPGTLFLAAASDGVDGTSGTAGAVVSRLALPDAERLRRAIEAFDTGPLHVSAGTALALGVSGVNLTDVHALVRAS
jgi:hydroxypyruvate reductase